MSSVPAKLINFTPTPSTSAYLPSMPTAHSLRPRANAHRPLMKWAAGKRLGCLFALINPKHQTAQFIHLTFLQRFHCPNSNFFFLCSYLSWTYPSSFSFPNHTSQVGTKHISRIFYLPPFYIPNFILSCIFQSLAFLHIYMFPAFLPPKFHPSTFPYISIKMDKVRLISFRFSLHLFHAITNFQIPSFPIFFFFKWEILKEWKPFFGSKKNRKELFFFAMISYELMKLMNE